MARYGIGYGGKNAVLELDMQYEYQGHQKNRFDEIANLMEFQLKHATKDLSCLKTDFDQIAENMETIAKQFIVQNKTIHTGDLLRSVKAEVIGNSISLKAPAKDRKTGHPYAGHIEYGFSTSDGGYHGPWPFLRPAVRLAAMESRGLLGHTLAANLINQDAVRSMVRSNGKIEFGRSGKKVSQARGSRMASQTRDRFEAGEGRYTGWNSARHGMWANKDSHLFTTSESKNWKWGNL